MIRFATSSVDWVDRLVAYLYLSFFNEKNTLITFIFHGLYRKEDEPELELINRHIMLSVDSFSLFVDYFQKHGYRFVSPEDILRSPEPNHKYALITFDDGYYNNFYSVPVLKKFRVPALFHISVNHVKKSKLLWSNVLFRERRATGYSPKAIMYEQKKLMKKTHDEIERYLIREFGSKALDAKQDFDRLMTPTELREFAKKDYVYLGNHTLDHAILTNYPPEGMREQIGEAQKYLEAMTSITPTIISYPYGFYSEDVINAAKECGLMLGITTTPAKNTLNFEMANDSRFRIGRFFFNDKTATLDTFAAFRSDISLKRLLCNF